MLKNLLFIFTVATGLVTSFTLKSTLPPSPSNESKPSTSTFNEYVEAVLQSTGLKPYNAGFLTKYHQRLDNTERLPHPYNFPFQGCVCKGCAVNGGCVGCLNRQYCERVGGRYCEN